MHSTAYYADPAGHVQEVTGDTWEHQSFQDKHLPLGWRGPFPARDAAEVVARQMAAAQPEPPTIAAAIARVEALEDAYDVLDGKDYEPINGIYPEGHIAQLLNAARRDLDALRRL